MRGTTLWILVAFFVLSSGRAMAHGRTGSVGGTVFGPNGQPSAGAEVMIERSDGSAPVAVRTDSEGRFVFKFVLAGYYDIRASRGMAATAWEHNVMIHVGKETAINLHLHSIRQSGGKE